MPTNSSAAVSELLARLPGVVQRADGIQGVPEEREPLALGHPEIDEILGGGLLRGNFSELVGHPSAGTTSLVQRFLSRLTAESRWAAWIDLADAFDPRSARAAGVDLRRLLWVRPPDLASALKATEILLGTSGFTLVLLDATRETGRGEGKGRPNRGPGGQLSQGRRMLAAPQTWLRLSRAARKSEAAMILLSAALGPPLESGSRGLAGAAADVRLEISTVQTLWDGISGASSLLEGLVSRVEITRHRGPGKTDSRSRQVRIQLS